MQLYIVGGVAPTPYILIKMTQLILDVLKEIEQVPTSACTLYHHILCSPPVLLMLLSYFLTTSFYYFASRVP